MNIKTLKEIFDDECAVIVDKIGYKVYVNKPCRKVVFVNDLKKVPYSDRIANYIEANVDDIIECYKEADGNIKIKRRLVNE